MGVKGTYVSQLPPQLHKRLVSWGIHNNHYDLNHFLSYCK